MQRYLSLTSHVYTPAYVTVGVMAWTKLPDDVRDILEETARETQEFVYSTAERMDSELLEQVTASGIQVNLPDRAKFLDASRAIYDEFGTAVPGGKELVERSLALRRGGRTGR